MNNYEYLSDEALHSLIACSEEQGLLSAPRELKQSILTEAARQSVSQPKASRKKQFADYCLRVGLATAATLVLVFAGGGAAQHTGQLPQQDAALSVANSQQFVQFTDRLEQDYQSLNQKLSQFIFNLDFGGNRHE